MIDGIRPPDNNDNEDDKASNPISLDKENKDEEQKETTSSLEPIGEFVWDLAKILLLALIVIVPIRFLVFQPFIVSGSSMEPNYSHGDYLIIDEISYRFNEPQRGDVVVLRSPTDPSQFFIKRIIGLPGERVIISNSKVKVYTNPNEQGHTLDEDYLPLGTTTRSFKDSEVSLSPSEYYVLGDNREASSDSRVWGELNRKNIIGKVWIKVFPISDFSLFNRPEYAIP